MELPVAESLFHCIRLRTQLRHFSLVGWLIVFAVFPLFSQVPNDNLTRRIKLPLDAPPHHSSTTKCTVEWNCVSAKAVTRCMIFHNDQWFEFTTSAAGTYYLNVSNQNCRDINGVQALLIDGTPCEPATYRYLLCQSNGTQDDIALTLDSLESNHTYLLNIDGYLNDFCQFDIGISTRPPDFAITRVPNAHKAQYELQDRSLLISWIIPKELEGTLTEFYLLRRHASEKRFTRIGSLPVIANTYGKQETQYTYRDDSLRNKGVYHYKIVGTGSNTEKYLINELAVNYNPSASLPAEEDSNVLAFTFSTKKYLHFYLYLFDADTNRLLMRRALNTRSGDNYIHVDIRAFLEQGIGQYRVEIRSVDKPEAAVETFSFFR